MLKGRLDRQLRIEGWDQRVLDEAKIGVVGDDDLLASLYVVSSSALGLNHLVVIAPRLDGRLLEIAQEVNPALNTIFIEGFYTHHVMDEIFTGCNIVVDVSHYGLANKLLLERGFRDNIPLIRGFCYEQDDQQGFKVFTYTRGREWRELEEIVSPQNLPGDHFDDLVLDLMASGVALEETKNLLMGQDVSGGVITYQRKTLATMRRDPDICVVGAGALGNFVGLGLASSGFRKITFIDPDVVEVSNLNRQVLLSGAVGASKAEVLSERLNRLFGANAHPCITSFRRDTDISPYDVIFDCVDNFETRIILSEKCQEQKKVLISGGTSVDAGQVVVYDPAGDSGTPAAVLGLYDLVEKREMEISQRQGASCADPPDPSVVMVNQIIAGFMVDSYRRLLSGQETTNIFYDSTSDQRI